MPRTAPPSRLGAVITAKRNKLGLSQRQLAEKVGLSNATICKLEKDPNLDPDIRTIRLLADALELDYNYLLTLNETIPDEPNLRIIARASRSMSEEDNEKMMEILRVSFSDAFEAAISDGVDDIDLY